MPWRLGRARMLRKRWLLAPVAVSQRAVSVFPNGTEALMIANLPPEPEASAAGVRTSFILRQLQSKMPVQFAAPQPSTASFPGDDSFYHHVPVNDTKRANQVIEPLLERVQHLLVIFDRFYAEEMHSHRFHSSAASAKTTLVLDMQDFHALRYARQTNPEALLTADDPRLQRELASIYRCDLTLVCSAYELQLLTELYGVPESKLCLAPLFGDCSIPGDEDDDSGDVKANLSFEERQDFVFIGGFRHAPNVDAVRRLHNHLWPRIRRHPLLRDTQLHIYGAYCPSQLQQELHNPQQGFLMHGFQPDVQSLLRDKRVMLSPLRFGAGIKGKHIEAWKAGLPVVTTPIGSEGMTNTDAAFGGMVATTDDAFVAAAQHLYTDRTTWKTATLPMPQLLQPLLGDGWSDVESKLAHVMQKLQERRQQDYLRSILWQHSMRSTEYFSKYLEVKEKNSTEHEPGLLD